MKYIHHSAISANLFHFVFRFGFWQTFERHTIFVWFCSFEKNGQHFQLDSPWLRTRHCRIGVERSSAVPSNCTRKWQTFAFTFVFLTRDSKQQLEAVCV